MGAPSKCDAFLSYESERFILIKNWKLALTFRTLQVAVIFYIIGYQIIMKQGYMEHDTLIGVTSTKVKGTGSAGVPGSSAYQIYDVYDLIPNPIEMNGLYISTNFFDTLQTRGICTGNDATTEGCTTNTDCIPGKLTANGVIVSSLNSTAGSSGTCSAAKKGFCSIYSWCPLEIDNKNPTQNIITGIANWTIYLKVNVDYPHFDKQLSNTFPTAAADKGLRPGVNLFAVEDILTNASTSYDAVSEAGAIILGLVTFDCNFETGGCSPVFNFKRLDPPDSPGFNYRYTIKSPISGYRDLVKSFGIRFLFSVSGIGSQFSILPLMIAIGSGVGLLSVATLVCDFVLQKFLPDKDRYLAEKFQHVADVGMSEFSARDVLDIQELANTRYLSTHANGNANQNADGSSLASNGEDDYKAMHQN